MIWEWVIVYILFYLVCLCIASIMIDSTNKRKKDTAIWIVFLCVFGNLVSTAYIGVLIEEKYVLKREIEEMKKDRKSRIGS